MGVFSRSAQPWNPRRFGHGHEWSAKSHADGSGTRMAHRRAPGSELEDDSEMRERFDNWLKRLDVMNHKDTKAWRHSLVSLWFMPRLRSIPTPFVKGV